MLYLQNEHHKNIQTWSRKDNVENIYSVQPEHQEFAYYDWKKYFRFKNIVKIHNHSGELI